MKPPQEFTVWVHKDTAYHSPSFAPSGARRMRVREIPEKEKRRRRVAYTVLARLNRTNDTPEQLKGEVEFEEGILGSLDFALYEKHPGKDIIMSTLRTRPLTQEDHPPVTVKVGDRIEIDPGHTITVTKVTTEPAAYPPHESTWPEKPAPPEGCEWVRQPLTVTGGNVEGELIMLNADTQWWRMRDCCWTDRVVFKAVPIPLTLEVGKYYINRRGETVGPVVLNKEKGYSPGWRFRVEDQGTFTEEGRYDVFGKNPHSSDLISIHPDHELAEAARHLPTGFVGPVRGPLKGTNGRMNPDIRLYDVNKTWVVSATGCSEHPYALRSGSEIARINGFN